MRFLFLALCLSFVLAPAAFAQAPDPAPPPPAETSGSGFSNFIEKLKYPFSGLGASRPDRETEVPPPPSAAAAPGDPEYMQVTPETKKSAEEAKPKRKKAVKKKSKKKKRKAKAARKKKPDVARRDETEKTGRGSASTPPAAEAAAEPPSQPAPVAEPGTPLGALALYKARMGTGDLDGAIGALNGIVRTEPTIEFVALLNETVAVALNVEAANLMVDKIRQTASSGEPAEPAPTRVDAARETAEPSAPAIAALAEYRQAVVSGDDAGAQAALARFVGHPVDDESIRQANALLGLQAPPDLAQGAAQ